MQILPNSGHQMAQNQLESHRIRVDYAVYERQLFPKAAVQPSTWQANANVALVVDRRSDPHYLHSHIAYDSTHLPLDLYEHAIWGLALGDELKEAIEFPCALELPRQRARRRQLLFEALKARSALAAK